MNKLIKTIIGGLVGTLAMTIIIMLAPLMGMPKMSPPDMLATTMSVPLIVGWMMHFVTGVMFAVIYTYLFKSKVSINNVYLKGATFGFAVFICAQILMAIMKTMLPMPKMIGPLVLILMGNIIGHIIYGVVVAQMIEPKPE